MGWSRVESGRERLSGLTMPPGCFLQVQPWSSEAFLMFVVMVALSLAQFGTSWRPSRECCNAVDESSNTQLLVV